MPAPTSRYRFSLVALCLAGALGCGGSSDKNAGNGAPPTGAAGASTSGGASASGGGAGVTSNGGAGGGIDLGIGGAAGMGVSVAYVSTDTSLYVVDPTDPKLPVAKIGDFDCVGDGGSAITTSMTDIAVNAQGELWGIGAVDLFKLEVQNGGVVHCASSQSLKAFGEDGARVRFYALSFAPAGVLDATKEVLVAGNSDGELWSLADDGTATQVGTFGAVPNDDGQGHPFDHPGVPFELSGDIVFLENDGAPIGFATVRDCPNPPDTDGCASDTLVEVDVPKLGQVGATGSVVKQVLGKLVPKASCAGDSASAFRDMYGVASWNDKVFGFSHTGLSVTIDNANGGTCTITDYTSQGIIWTGAGVTTRAPVIAPPVH